MAKYLGSVEVKNLLPADYRGRVKEIEKAIQEAIDVAISPPTTGRLEVTDENVVFHFSQDRSVRSSEIPVELTIQFRVRLYIVVEEQNTIADVVRTELLRTVFRGRGDVLVNVLTQGPTGQLIVAFSPRY